MADYFIKQNDTAPAIRGQCQDPAGNPVDLSGGSAQFHMRESDGDTAKVDAVASIVDAGNGKVEYQWSSGDTDATGTFEAEFEITYSDGTIETFPNGDTYVSIKIAEEIA